MGGAARCAPTTSRCHSIGKWRRLRSHIDGCDGHPHCLQGVCALFLQRAHMVSASSVHVERWRGALDDLFRDHDLLDAFGRAQPALRIRAYPRKQAMQSCPLAISTLWGMLRLYWVTSRRNAVWFSLPTISPSRSRPTRYQPRTAGCSALILRGPCHYQLSCASTSRRTVFKPSKERRTRDA